MPIPGPNSTYTEYSVGSYNPLYIYGPPKPGVYSPLDFGADGRGLVDDTKPVLAAFAAASLGGTVDLGCNTYLVSQPIPLVSYLRVRADGQRNGGIVNNTTDIFQVAPGATVTCVTIQDCFLFASAGHVFNWQNGSVSSFIKVSNTYLMQSSPTHSLWYMPNGGMNNNVFDDRNYWIVASGATAIPFYVSGLAAGNSVNKCTWKQITAISQYCTNPFFVILCTAAVGRNNDLHFEDITAEEAGYGVISLTGAGYCTMDNVSTYDVDPYTGDLISLTTGSGGLSSVNNSIRSGGRRDNVGFTSGNDVNGDANTTGTVVENFGPEFGLVPSYNLVAGTNTVIWNGVYAGGGNWGPA